MGELIDLFSYPPMQILATLFCFALLFYLRARYPHLATEQNFKEYMARFDEEQEVMGASNGQAVMPDFVPPQSDTPSEEPGDIIAQVPSFLLLQDVGQHFPTTTSLSVGMSREGLRWLDLDRDTLHIGLYATSGAGKDNLLRGWFCSLAVQNDPSEVQFAIIDGKGDWLTPNLAVLEHMFVPPAGGYGKEGDQRIMEAIEAIDTEAARRQKTINRAGCITREEYVKKTGETMPLLVVIATDVMTSVAGKVEELLVNLVSKARSLGIRVVISMQTPTGRDTRWRVNLTTIVAGALQSGSHDGPALGIDVKEMLYRPSRLPSPQDRPGIFVVRHGSIQTVVQAPFVPMDDFVEVIESLPVVPDPYLVAALSGVEDAPERSESRSAEPERLNAGFGLSEATFGSRSRSGERADSSKNGHSDGPNANANETVVMTPDELAQVAQAVRAYHDGATKEQAITGAFGCRKGSSKAYRRASLLFNLAIGSSD